MPPASPVSDAVQATISPDDSILVLGFGTRSLTARNVITHTLDPSISSPTVGDLIANYRDTTFADKGESPLLSSRLSPDGTRLVLGSKQVWVARRNMSAPPRITKIDDRSVADTATKVSIRVPLGAYSTFAITAEDPEGDPISCDAFFLQDGMSFDRSACKLRWTPTAPVGTKFYVKFQVTTNTWPRASGGTDAIIAEFTVTPTGEAGCPFVDTRTDSGWHEENSILGRSLTRSMLSDVYRLKALPSVSDGRYQVRLRESEREYTTLDQVRLVAVDHAPDTLALALGDHIILGSRRAAARVTTRNGTDITALVNGTQSSYFIGQPGETLLVAQTVVGPAQRIGFESTPIDSLLDTLCVNLQKTLCVDIQGVREIDPGCKDHNCGGGDQVATRSSLEGTTPVTDAAVLATTGILTQACDTNGVWQLPRVLYPRQFFDEFLVDSLRHDPFRLIFMGRHSLRYVGQVKPTRFATSQVLPLLAARHSRLGDVMAALTSSDGSTSVLTPGDTIGLEFQATAVPMGQVRDFFLFTKGVYSSTPPQFLQETTRGESPVAFALRQNLPNPFSRVTTIQFDLPVASHVRLEIFDLQGRLVTRLADRMFKPGRWASAWDRRDASGMLARPGVYLYRIMAGSHGAERKMVLLP